MNENKAYDGWKTKYVGCGTSCLMNHRDVIKIRLDDCDEQVIEVDGEHRIVLHKDYYGNLTVKTQHKEWVDDDSEPEYGLQA